MGSLTRSSRSRKNPDQTVMPLDSGPAWVVYVLCDPRVDDPVMRVRYVGKTEGKNPKKRFWGHISEAHRGKMSHKANWVRQLLINGMEPVFEIIDSGASVRPWDRSEISWIKYYRDLGCPLTNQTDGGEGLAGHKKSPETRERMRQAQKNRRESEGGMSDETRAKIGASWAHRVVTEETRAKLKEATTRRYAEHPEEREKLRQAMLARPPASEETREKLRKASTGRVMPRYGVEKSRAKNIGKKMSDETRMRMSESQKAHKADISVREQMSIAGKKAWSIKKAKRKALSDAALEPSC